MEGVLDYIFVKLGVDASTNGINRPLVMTETVANLPYARKSKCQIATVEPKLTLMER